MMKFCITTFLVFFFAVTIYVFFDSKNTFTAKFANIDGLPLGAPVTALGVKIGKVVSTRAVSDGVLVKVKVTNKSVPKPPSGSKLSITSFAPAKGRTLEVVLPDAVEESEAWIIQDPISTQTWLLAAIEILDNIKSVSLKTIEVVTPQNVHKVRSVIGDISDTLKDTGSNLRFHENRLSDLHRRFDNNADKTKELLTLFQGSINSLEKIFDNKEFTSKFKSEVEELEEDLAVVAKTVNNPEFKITTKKYRDNMIQSLDKIQLRIQAFRDRINDKELLEEFDKFNEYIVKLNSLCAELNKRDIHQEVGEGVHKGRAFSEEINNLSKKAIPLLD